MGDSASPTTQCGQTGIAFPEILARLEQGTVVEDGDARVLRYDEAARRILGPGAFVQVRGTLRLLVRASRTDGTPLEQADWPAERARRTATAETALIRLDALPGERWVLVRSAPLEVAGESLVLTTLLDVTAARSEFSCLERLATVASESEEGVLIADARGRTEWVNAAFSRMTGWTLADMSGRPPHEILHGPETDALTVANLRKTLSEGKPWRGEILNYRWDGSTFWADVSITPVTDETGRVTHYVSLSRDVSTRRRSSQRLMELAAAVERTADGIAVLDREGRFRFANDSFARLFDLRRGSELWGKAWRRLQPGGVVQYIERQVLPRLWETGQWRGEVRREDRGGGQCVQELTLAVVGSHSVVVVAREKTEQAAEEVERKVAERGVPAR